MNPEIDVLTHDLRELYRAFTTYTLEQLRPSIPPKEWELRHTDEALIHEALLELLLTRIKQTELPAVELTRLERRLKSPTGRRAVKDQASTQRRAEKASPAAEPNEGAYAVEHSFPGTIVTFKGKSPEEKRS